jgi:hypothetical protein
MGRRQGQNHARSRIAAALLALVLSSCNGNYAYQVSSVGAPPVPPPNAGIVVTTTSGGGFFGAFLALGMIAVGAGAFPLHDPGMHPDRRVLEQDCTRPIEDYSANLKCR